MLDNICKEAVTIYIFIDDVLHDEFRGPYFRVTNKRTNLVKKATRKFIRDYKESEYKDELDRYGKTYLSHFIHHMVQKEEEYNSIFLTWLQFQFHSFIHAFCQEYDPADKWNSKKATFYKQVLERLVR